MGLIEKNLKPESRFSPAKDLLVFQLVDSSLDHFVFRKPLSFYDNPSIEVAMFGMGCFWGVERLFWGLEGVVMTAVGYSAGTSGSPDYNLVCTKVVDHSEVVLVHFQPGKISFSELLKLFWESHDPTQGMRQGNDIGVQYRSGIYAFSEEQYNVAFETKDHYSSILERAKFSSVTTEILPANKFYYAEEYHQQYLAKNPRGYCALEGTGINF